VKFLVIGEGTPVNAPQHPKDLVTFIEHAVMPTYQILEQWEKAGKLVGGNYAGQTKGAFILEASSNDEVADMLTSLPLWGNLKFEVYPLQSLQSGINETKKQLEQLKQMGSRQPP
jgi:muconolactone delta-isomerase